LLGRLYMEIQKTAHIKLNKEELMAVCREREREKHSKRELRKKVHSIRIEGEPTNCIVGNSDPILMW
jgi:hypothetical protein